MSVKAKLKATDIGLVPIDWEVYKLVNVAERVSVGLATSVTKFYRSSGTPIIRNLNIKDGFFDPSDMLYLEPAFAKQNASKSARAFDVLTVHTGSNLGLTCVLPATFDSCQTFTTLITTVNTRVLNPYFLARVMSSNYGKSEMARLQVGGGKGNLNTADLKKFRVALPPTLTEQEAIAGALADADTWIESLEQMVAKKRQIKQGAMQELLTGKRRLPGFSGKWETRQLSALGNFAKGSGVSKAQANSGDIPCVRYGEIYTRHRDYIRTFYSGITREVAATAAQLRQGDVLFAGSGETKEEIGKCVAFVDEFEAYAGGDIVILRTTEGDPVFLGYYLNTESIAAQKASRGQGDAVVHISASALGSITVCIPDSHEQQAIGRVLKEMDSDLYEIESKLAKSRKIKQAMMQELLPGRIRFVEPMTSKANMQEAAHV